jgi:hypothetical protein
VLAAWTPTTLPGELDGLRAEVDPPPEGLRLPSDWGRAEIARERLAPHFDHLETRLHTVELRFDSERDCWHALTRPLGLSGIRRGALRPRFDALLEAQNAGPPAVALPARYLVVLGRRPE